MEQTLLPRLAWFTPLPPVRSGIAQYSFELLPGLASRYQIDLFVDGPPGGFSQPDPATPIHSAHDFVWMHFRRPYDLVVYQLGNAACHDYMWAYLARYPGLAVLHDGQLHHARGRQLRAQGRYDDYEQEFVFNHPGVDVALAELGIAGRLGWLTFLWPMRRVVLQSARMVAVHNGWLADQINQENPETKVAVIEMGVPDLAPSPGAREAVRVRHQIPADAMLFVAFGDVTPEKRIAQAIRQLASIRETVPHAHLLLAGKTVEYYNATAEAEACGVSDRVTIAGFIPDDEIADHLAAADVCLCLRWPTSRETSAAWLRCLAAGRPTIVTDLAHTADIASYDPRGWTVLHAPATSTDAAGWPVRSEPVCVSIDILDEEHSLQMAMQRLATDAQLRQRLGQRARTLWAERFSLDRMVARYPAVIDEALASPLPSSSVQRSLPAHFRTDGTEHASALLREAGLPDAQIHEALALFGGSK